MAHQIARVAGAPKRSTGSLIPDGEQIQRRRLEYINVKSGKVGLTQVQLVKRVEILIWERDHKEPGEGPGLSHRAYRNIEAGKACRTSTLELVALGLGCEVDDIVKGPNKLCWAMMDEMVSSANGGLGKPGGVFFRLLQAIEGVSNEKVAELELLLALAVRRDVAGDSHGALRLGLLLVKESAGCDSGFQTRVLVRTASFCDHVGDPQRGLLLLDPIIRKEPSRGTTSEEEWWARFQCGILLAGADRKAEAKRMLQTVRADAPLPEQRTASLHQLAVLDLDEGQLLEEDGKFVEAKAKFSEAKDRLESCVKERRKLSKDDFRLAYEYRRLCEACEEMGESGRANDYGRRAEAITNNCSFGRYAEKLARSRQPRTRKPHQNRG